MLAKLKICIIIDINNLGIVLIIEYGINFIKVMKFLTIYFKISIIYSSCSN